MDEPEFWIDLEYRICAEFAGFADRQLRSCWCDGLIPEEYDLAGTEPRISGVAFCGPSGQERWRFTLVVGKEAASPRQVDWSALLPSDRLTGWLADTRPPEQDPTDRPPLRLRRLTSANHDLYGWDSRECHASSGADLSHIKRS